ncbi:MAG: hypothetical protein GWP91_04830 [Rhodobacterales bacterium]|nr:hypothetical protein [Rhodobacterales bacterium]
MLRSTLLLALCATASPAYAITDAPFDVGDVGSDNVNSRAMKFNRYDVRQAVQLQEYEVYLNPQNNNTEGTFAIYEETGGGGFGGSNWDLLWDSGTVVLSSGEGMKGSGAIGITLMPSQRYLIGYFIDDDTEYFHQDVGDEDLGWAVVDRTYFNTGNTFGGLPNTFSNYDNANSHYRQRVVVGLPDDLDGDGANEFIDCDDSDANFYPGAPELCDGLDNNCNDEIDDNVEYHDVFEDADGDGFGAPEGATESVGEPDAPDGFSNQRGDCDDDNAQVNPDMEELCDGLDNNCDGDLDVLEFDLDGDGVYACDDCDDDAAEIFTGQTETCNGVDNDCDGDAPTADNCDIDDFSTEGLVLGDCGCNQSIPGGSLPAFSVLLLAGLIRRRRV